MAVRRAEAKELRVASACSVPLGERRTLPAPSHEPSLELSQADWTAPPLPKRSARSLALMLSCLGRPRPKRGRPRAPRRWAAAES